MFTSGVRRRIASGTLGALLSASGLSAATAMSTPPAPVPATEARSAPASHAALVEAPPDGSWLWPVAGRREVAEPFRAPAHDYGPGHRGIDIIAPVGVDVRAPADGVVAFRGTVVDRPLLTIDHGGGIVTTFEPLASDLRPGDVVTAGRPVGTVAVGGHTRPGSLHLGVRVHGVYTNPLPLFGAIPRAVLLPCCAPL